MEEPFNPAAEAMLVYARHMVGWATSESLIDGAVRLLERGADTNELRLMAGCWKNDHPEDLRAGFRAVLESLGVLNLEHLDWSCVVGHAVCTNLLIGTIKPWAAVGKMYALWIECNFNERFERWMRLSESHDLVLSGYPPLEPFPHFTLENAEQIIRKEAKRFPEQNPETACLEKES